MSQGAAAVATKKPFFLPPWKTFEQTVSHVEHALGFFYVLPDARNREHLSAIREDRPRAPHPNYLEAIRRGKRPNFTDGDRHTFGTIMLSKYRRALGDQESSVSTPWTPEEFAEMWVDEYFAARRELDPSFVEIPTASVGDGSPEPSGVTAKPQAEPPSVS